MSLLFVVVCVVDLNMLGWLGCSERESRVVSEKEGGRAWGSCPLSFVGACCCDVSLYR